MNLTLFFRLILMSIFQRQIVYDKKNYNNEDMSYNNQLFYCPVVYAKDGFNVSLQIHNGKYCSSNNGYRELGDTMNEVEFGFPSESESLMKQYAECYGYAHDEEYNEIPFDEESFDITNSVGRVPISVMETVFEKHGGIDWETTISIEQFNKFIKVQ